MYAGVGMNIQAIHINGVEKNLGRYIFNADQALAFLIICLFIVSPIVIVKNVFKPENRQPQDENLFTNTGKQIQIDTINIYDLVV